MFFGHGESARRDETKNGLKADKDLECHVIYFLPEKMGTLCDQTTQVFS